MKRFLLFLFFLCLSINIKAQTWLQAERAFGPGGYQDLYGWSVSIDGNYAVVGAPDDENDSNLNTGAAYVYLNNNGNWEYVARLLPSDGRDYDDFGKSVDIAGSTIVVGAPGADYSNTLSAGMVYVFEMPSSGWQNMTETARLQLSQPAAYEYLGHSVAISGATVAGGGTGKNNNTGGVYLFEKDINGWASMTETAALFASDGHSGDYFGWSLDIDGNTVAVGAIYHDYLGIYNIGSAYVFEKPQTGWVNTGETAKLVPSNSEITSNMGNSISISNNTVSVGAVLSSPDGSGNDGLVLLYEKPGNGWSDMGETYQLTSPRPESSSFGKSVALSPDQLVVSAPHHSPDPEIPSGGIVYVYSKRNGSWDFENPYEIYATDAVQGTALGYYVAVSGNAIIASATGIVDYNWAVGSAYFFQEITNQPPIASEVRNIEVLEDAAAVNLNLYEIFSDPDGPDEALTFEIIQADPDLLQASLNQENLTISFLPDSFGITQIIVEATDSHEGRGRCTIAVEVKPVPDPMIISAGDLRYGEKGSITISRNPADGREVNTFIFQTLTDQILYFTTGEKVEPNTPYLIGNETAIVLEVQPEKAGQVGGTLAAAVIEGDYSLYGEATLFQLSIQKANLQLTTHNIEKEYGDPMPEVSFSIDGFVNGDTKDVLTQQPSLISDIPLNIQAGNHELQLGNGLAENYNISYVPGTLKVLKAPLAVLAKDMAIAQGSPIPDPEIVYSNFKLEDGKADIDELPSATINADENSLPGTYEINTGGGRDDNYYFLYINGILTIETVTSIKDEFKDRIKIFPVPTSNKVWITMENNTPLEVSLLSNTGNEIQKTSSEGDDVNFDLSNLPTGIYCLKITSKEGSAIRKIIKQ